MAVSLLASIVLLAVTSCTANRESQLGLVSISQFSAVAPNGAGVAALRTNPGQSVELRWVVTGAKSVSISDGTGPVKNAVALSGSSILVKPSVTTTYTLTATGLVPVGTYGDVKDGSVSAIASDGSPAAVTITVVPAPVIASFKASPEVVTFGENVDLNWSVSNSNTLNIAPYNPVTKSFGAGQDVTGTSSLTFQPTETNQYQLLASTLSEIPVPGVAATVNITVLPRPTVTLQASNTNVLLGQSIRLSWTSSNATTLLLRAVDASQPGGIVTDVSQLTSELVSPSITTTYTLIAKNALGSSVSSLPVTVNVTTCPPPEIAQFAAQPVSTGANTNVSLTAIFTGGLPGDAGIGTIDNGIGSVTSGIAVASPMLTSSTRFQLTVKNNCGNSSQMTTRVPVGSITLLAGNSTQGSQDGQGSAASFYSPTAIARDASGNLYVTDFGLHDVRKITQSGTVTRYAGIGDTLALGYVDGPALSAKFNSPKGVAVDSNGKLYVADSGNQVIRVITPGVSPVVSTLAGTPNNASYHDGAGSDAGFNGPSGLAMGPNNFLYVADSGNNLIRAVNINTGEVTTLAGAPPGISGNSNAGFQDGAGSLAKFNNPQSLTYSSDGNLYVSDRSNRVIRKVSLDGNVTTIAGTAGVSGTQDGDGVTSALFGYTGSITENSGTLFVSDPTNYTIRRLSPGQNGFIVDTIVGTAGSVVFAPSGPLPGRLNQAQGILADPTSGKLYMTINSTILSAPY